MTSQGEAAAERWESIRVAYETDDSVTVWEIARLFGSSTGSIQRKAKKEGWIRRRAR